MVPTLDRNHRFTPASRQRTGLRLLGALAVALIAAQPVVGQTTLGNSEQWRLTGGGTSVAHWQSSPPLTKFMTEIRNAGTIPVATSFRTVPWGATVATHYTIDINQYQDKLHPQLKDTTLWGYHPSSNLTSAPQAHLGGIIIAQRGEPVQITFRNNLPNKHILPVDTSIMGANVKDIFILGTGKTVTENRTATHLHGGAVPWFSDGGPFGFFDAQGNKGVSFVNNQVLRPAEFRAKTIPVNEAEYYYPNDQSARMAWYHDHAMGITRLNAYAGIASAYIIRDNFEKSLVATKGLPEFVEVSAISNGSKPVREMPLVFQDKIFQNQNATPDASNPFPGSAKGEGNLWYPYDYDMNLWNASTAKIVSVVPESYGDTMLVNGTAFPKATVDPRRYRFRVLNACQARVLNLQLYEEGVTSSGIPTGQPDFSKPGPNWTVIGTEGGFLARPVSVPSNQPLRTLQDAVGGRYVDPAAPGGSLIIAGGERLDLVVDFNGLGGKNYILYNDAPAPYPNGAPENDYPNYNGVGDTSVMMRFEVQADSTTLATDPNWKITSLAEDANSKIDPPLAGLLPGAAAKTLTWASTSTAPLPIPTRAGVKVRQLTLNEAMDLYGRLIQMLGTNVATGATMTAGVNDFSRPYSDPTNAATRKLSATTETAKDLATEVWQIANLTGDTHPIHFHLVNAQILSRQPFDAALYAATPVGTAATPTFTDVARGPEATEVGWKETIKMHPGEVTTVIMKFQLPKVPFAVPESPRTSGHEYVWHCHILEHEEHDMMRTLVVKP